MSKLFPAIIAKLTTGTFIGSMSIKALTLLGFCLVVLPLTGALLYSASQVNILSEQGRSAIINVAELVDKNKQLSTLINQTQRFASQYAVLKEPELFLRYQQQQKKLSLFITTQYSTYSNEVLQQNVRQLKSKLNDIDKQVGKLNESQEPLSDIDKSFKSVVSSVQQINMVSNQLISQLADQITLSADDLNSTMLHSLVSIPLAVIIAVTFILLIIQPLKQISYKIRRLELGLFEDKITFSGSSEIKEIAQALELMRSRLHALELQKSTFIRHISHELKTPLAAIREGTELLYDNSVGSLNTDQQEITNIIKESVFRLQQLIEDLLDFNIVLDSTSLQQAQNTHLPELISKCIKVRKLDWQRKKINLTTNVAALSITTNAKQLSVVLDNLLSNAIKYAPDNSVINVGATANDSHVAITVSDSGPGIAEQVKQLVFDAFYQGPAPLNSTIKSSGLGLTIVKELTMRLGGTVTMANHTAPEHGLIVTLLIPRHFQGSSQ